jgi:muconolactone delta-isomerase
MKFVVFTRPIEGIEENLPRPRNSRRRSDGFVSSLTWAASIAPITCENHTVAIVNAESREDLEQLYGTMPLVQLADPQVEALGSLFDQMQGVLKSLRKYYLSKS